MVTAAHLLSAMRTAWCDAYDAPPVERLGLPHLLLVQQQWTRPSDVAAGCVAIQRRHGEASPNARLAAEVQNWRDGRDGHALLACWEEAVLAVEHERWMPRLIGLRPALLTTPAYTRLGVQPYGGEAMMLLLLLAGETGFRPIIMHWASAAARMGVPEAHLLAAAALLDAEGWVEREPLGDEGEAVARVLTLRPDRAPVILARPVMA
jgi:hypothetical protein